MHRWHMARGLVDCLATYMIAGSHLLYDNDFDKNKSPPESFWIVDPFMRGNDATVDCHSMDRGQTKKG